MTKARDIADFKFENIVDTGTAGTKVASGTTAQRGSTTGQWRYNTDTGYFEGRNASGAFSTLEPTPTIISTDTTDVDSAGGGNITIRVTGTNFATGGTIKFIANDNTELTASTSTFINTSNYDATIAKSSFVNSKEPYDVKYISSTGLTATLTDNINVDNAPAWATGAGNLGSVPEGSSANITVSATDADGDTVSYSETTGNLTGAGFSLNSSTGAITGTASAVSNDTTTSFTLRATAGSKTTDRAFNIITKNLTTQALLFDATNLGGNASGIPTSNGNGLGSASVNTAVTFSNVNGSSGTLAHGDVLSAKSDTYSHYTWNDNRTHHIGQTFWSLATVDPHEAGNSTGAWFGTHHGSSKHNYDLWITMDYGSNPSFKITRMTGDATWRTGTANYYLYGTNDVSNVGGNDGGSDAGSLNTTGLTQIFNVANPASNWDSGYQTGDFYRYYVYRITVNTSGGYDWGWDASKWYGDYY